MSMQEKSDTQDYYEILGISKEASSTDIKSAYRHLAKKYHPDLCSEPDAEEKFKKLSEAYEVLIDDLKRKEYNKKGQQVVEETFGTKGFSWTKFTHYKDIEDIYHKSTFDSFLKREHIATHGSDIRVDLEISLEDCAQGVKTFVNVPYTIPCSHCGGTGSENMKFTVCKYCKGEGQLKNIQGYGSTQIIDLVVCMNCEGTGRVCTNKCNVCKGKGTSKEYREISVKIPPGAIEGFRIRIPGMGERGANGGANGNLFVVVKLRAHPSFKLYGRNIHSDLQVKFTDAVLGHEVTIKTIWGESKIKLLPGTQPGEIFRLNEMGMPGSYDVGLRGDHIVRIVIGDVPRKISPKQKKLLEEFEKISEENESNENSKRKGLFRWKK